MNPALKSSRSLRRWACSRKSDVARLASGIFVSAFLRAENAAGRHAVVLRKGAAEAGAIFVLQRLGNGACRMFAPAPQAALASGAARAFEQVATVTTEADAERYLAREAGFDPDCWVLETDGEQPPPSLNLIA